MLATNSPRSRVTVITTGLSNDCNGASDSGLMDEWRASARQCDKGCNPHHEGQAYTNTAATY